MAIKHLCSVVIEDGERIALPKKANFYRKKSGEARYFHVNPKPVPSLEAIPTKPFLIFFKKKPYSMEFKNYRRNRGNIQYGETIFYDKNNNIF